ncbi:MAG TPA: glycosyltransferase [Sphingobium sp.]
METRKGSYVLATWEGGGSVAPFMTLARKLLAVGHDVHIISDLCNGDEALAAGAGFTPWTRAPSRPTRLREDCPIRDWEVADPGAAIARVFDLQIAGRAQDYAQDMIALLRQHPADLVVINELALGAMMGCEIVGQPFAVLGCGPLLYPLVDGIPPLGPGLPPARTEAERGQHAEVATMVTGMLDSFLPRYNEQRVSLGLQPLAHLHDQNYAAQRFLMGTNPAFDFEPAKLPDFFTYVGAQLDDNLWSRPWESPWTAGDERPLVLASLSTTFMDQAECLRRIVAALATLDVRAVVTLGGVVRPDEVPGAANVHVVDSAPHAALLKDASLVINHGGHGTIMKAATAGLPQLVIPHGRDQGDNAVRIAHRGAGLILPRDAEADAIRDAAARLLGDPAYALAAQALARRIAERDDPGAITREVERLAATLRGAQVKVA